MYHLWNVMHSFFSISEDWTGGGGEPEDRTNRDVHSGAQAAHHRTRRCLEGQRLRSSQWLDSVYRGRPDGQERSVNNPHIQMHCFMGALNRMILSFMSVNVLMLLIFSRFYFSEVWQPPLFSQILCCPLFPLRTRMGPTPSQSHLKVKRPFHTNTSCKNTKLWTADTFSSWHTCFDRFTFMVLVYVILMLSPHLFSLPTQVAKARL